MGIWYPYHSSDRAFVKMALNVGRAICQTDKMFRQRYPHLRSIYVDSCENHEALDRKSQEWVNFANLRRFWMHDLVLGRISTSHPLLPYLERNGFSSDDRRWFLDRPVKIDVLGLDYYSHSEFDWYWHQEKGRADIRWPVSSPQGFDQLAAYYAARYSVPVMLSETNCRGTVSERVTWLRFMEEQCERFVARGGHFEGFCWYPSIDSTDWSSLCTLCRRVVDPQGIWLLDESRWDRIASELSETYANLARGTFRARDVHAYRLRHPKSHDLSGYLKLMNWDDWYD